MKSFIDVLVPIIAALITFISAILYHHKNEYLKPTCLLSVCLYIAEGKTPEPPFLYLPSHVLQEENSGYTARLSLCF